MGTGRPRRRYSFLAAAMFLCAVLLYFFYPSDENRIRDAIGECERAVVAEDIDGLMKFISYNYSDDYGNNYLMLKKRLSNTFRRLDNIDVEKKIKGISIQGEQAEVVLSVSVIASSSSAAPQDEYDRGYILGDARGPETIKVFLEKSTYSWLIIRVEGLNRSN
jgi:hypothetical protein